MEETAGATAYGVSLSGGGFDFYKFIRQPQTIVRILSWVSGARASGSSRFEAHVARRSSKVQIRHKTIFNVTCEQVRPAWSLRGADTVRFYWRWPETTGCCVRRLHGASSCTQPLNDSSSVTGQVNTAAVRGLKTENCRTHTETSASGGRIAAENKFNNDLLVYVPLCIYKCVCCSRKISLRHLWSHFINSSFIMWLLENVMFPKRGFFCADDVYKCTKRGFHVPGKVLGRGCETPITCC